MAKYQLDGDPESALRREKVRADALTEAGYEVTRVLWEQLWDEVALSRRIASAHRRVNLRHGKHPW